MGKKKISKFAYYARNEYVYNYIAITSQIEGALWVG